MKKIIYIDIDSLRPDHMGCYGYHRNTTPNMDRLAQKGVRFENYYTSDAPCLPSRTALSTSRFGIHTGVVDHGGRYADIRSQNDERGFSNLDGPYITWARSLRNAGYYTTIISPFIERHAAWHVADGFQEVLNKSGKLSGIADDHVPVAIDWIKANAHKEKWFLHLNLWDPHTPYNTPLEYGDPFEQEPAPEWPTEEIIKKQYASYGPNSAQDTVGYDIGSGKFPRMPLNISSREDYIKWINGYDTGIHYTDYHVGKVMDTLEELGLLEDTLIIISADHGENQGELNVYGDHQVADHLTTRVPLIVSGPCIKAGHVDRGFHYSLDLPATIAALTGAETGSGWDGKSFDRALKYGEDQSRKYLVVSQGAWSCQRGVRFGPWMLIRTYHDAFKDFPGIMLFNVEEDPHETCNLAEERRDIVGEGMILLDQWYSEMMHTSNEPVDPLWGVIHGGGPFHARRHHLEKYVKRLRETNREHHAEKLEKQYEI